jgi:fatty-acid desaturase
MSCAQVPKEYDGRLDHTIRLLGHRGPVHCTLTLLTFVGVPLFAYFYDYTLLDWVLLAVLYIVTGMGITVGYHRMITHRSFESHPWVKACLLVMGGWAVQNSALMWCADHIRHHAHTDEEADPYNASQGILAQPRRLVVFRYPVP